MVKIMGNEDNEELIDQFVGNISSEIKDLISKIQKSTLEKVERLEKENSELKDKKEKAEEELSHIKKQLDKLSESFEQISSKKKEAGDVRKMLGILTTLLIDVFGGMAHARLLFIMHGAEREWSREELANASGINIINVRKALADLARADLVEYNVETDQSKLLKRVF
jgi:seryl-tRNA synthetase